MRRAIYLISVLLLSTPACSAGSDEDGGGDDGLSPADVNDLGPGDATDTKVGGYAPVDKTVDSCECSVGELDEAQCDFMGGVTALLVWRTNGRLEMDPFFGTSTSIGKDELVGGVNADGSFEAGVEYGAPEPTALSRLLLGTGTIDDSMFAMDIRVRLYDDEGTTDCEILGHYDAQLQETIGVSCQSDADCPILASICDGNCRQAMTGETCNHDDQCGSGLTCSESSYVCE